MSDPTGSLWDPGPTSPASGPQGRAELADLQNAVLRYLDAAEAGAVLKANNLSDVANAATALANLGGVASSSVGVASGVAALNNSGAVLSVVFGANGSTDGNEGFGYGALAGNASAISNTAVGYKALAVNNGSTSGQNVAVGTYALNGGY